MGVTLVPKEIQDAMESLAEYMQKGTLANGVQIDNDIRNTILSVWIPSMFPTKGEWEEFADAISAGTIKHLGLEPSNQSRHLSLDEKAFYNYLGCTFVKASKLKKGDLIKVKYNGEPVIAIVLQVANTSKGVFLYFTVRGILKNSIEFRGVGDPFNAGFEEVKDFTVLLMKQRKIPRGFYGLGNLTYSEKDVKKAPYKPNTAGGRMAKGVANYIKNETILKTVSEILK